MTHSPPSSPDRQNMLDLTSSDHYYLMKAATESKNSNMASKHGCVAVLNGKIIGRGHNSDRTQSNDGFINNTCSCHAEIAAIRNVWHQTCSGSRYKNYQCVLHREEQNSSFQKTITLCSAYG